MKRVQGIARSKQRILMPKHYSVDDADRIEGDVQPLLVRYHIICFEKLVRVVNMI